MNDTEVHRQNIQTAAQATGAAPHLDAGWPRSHTLPVLAPGLYRVGVAPELLHAEERIVEFNDQRTYEAGLIVRPQSPEGAVLLVYSRDTQNAYNRWGGRSYYTDPPTFTIGEKRPGYWPVFLESVVDLARILESLGVGWDAADPRWIEEHPGALAAYRAVVLVSQSEYVTRDFRDAIEGFVDQGGRLLALGPELMLYQTRRVGDRLTCYKNPFRGVDPILSDGDPDNDHLVSYQWAYAGPPETTLSGTSTWLGHQLGQPGAWRVARSLHWVFAGTGLADGSTFREHPATGIVDGTDIAWEDGFPYVTNLQATQTPADTLVLATVPTQTAASFDCILPPPLGIAGGVSCYRDGHGTIAIRQTPEGGVVATVPDLGWLELMASDPLVQTITTNLLAAFASPAPMDVYAGYSPAP